MAREVKVLHVIFPETKETITELWFPSDIPDGSAIAYKFLVKNRAVVTNFEGFQDWEIEELINFKNALGDSFVQPECSSKDDPGITN